MVRQLRKRIAMKYDDASWHYEGDFPKDLPIEAAATHTGMFVAWALLSGLGGGMLVADFSGAVGKLRSRSLTPGEFFIEACDGKFTDQELNVEGNAFTKSYFEFKEGSYLADYAATLRGDLTNLYQIADTWENFDRLKPVLDRRFAEWKSR
jgi:hypothetical protein